MSSSLIQRVRPGSVLPGYVSGEVLEELQRDVAHLLPDHDELRADPRSYSDVLCTGVRLVHGPFGRERLDALVSSPDLAMLAAATLGAGRVRLHDVHLRGDYAGMARADAESCTVPQQQVVSLVLDVADGTLRITTGRSTPHGPAVAEPEVRATVVVRFTRC